MARICPKTGMLNNELCEHVNGVNGTVLKHIDDVNLVIPSIIHRIWIQGEPLPFPFDKYGESFKTHHPTFSYVLWDGKMLENIIYQVSDLLYTQYLSSKTYAQKADVGRFVLLYLYGGVYVDTDFECKRSIIPLLHDKTFVAGYEDTNTIATGIIASVPGHPILKKMIQEMLSFDVNKPPTETTGPKMFTKVVLDHSKTTEDKTVCLYPPIIFYPYHYTEKYKKNNTFDDAYAVHHWAASWQTGSMGSMWWIWVLVGIFMLVIAIILFYSI